MDDAISFCNKTINTVSDNIHACACSEVKLNEICEADETERVERTTSKKKQKISYLKFQATQAKLRTTGPREVQKETTKYQKPTNSSILGKSRKVISDGI